ncbi:lipoprotein [Vibrio navarrensis]|uniref:lipoprotein n=1 Tax=Vibrio navarrensis TaxID=29495 RepID=UPI001865C2ED|nr:hypothetical protein [Vibrio navarrensis]
MKKLLLIIVSIITLSGCDMWDSYKGRDIANNLCETGSINLITAGMTAKMVQAQYGETGRVAFAKRINECFPGLAEKAKTFSKD